MLRIATFLIVVVLANLPAGNDLRISHQLDRDGTTVQARVVVVSGDAGRHVVGYDLPGAKQTFTAAIDDDTAARARFSHGLAVRTLPGHPEVNRPVGRADGIAAFYVIAAIADVVLVVMLAAWVVRRRRRSVALQM